MKLHKTEALPKHTYKLSDNQTSMEGEGFQPIRTNFNPALMDEKFRSQKKMIVKSPEITAMCEQVLQDKKIEIGPASVGCLLIYPNISAKKASKVSKLNETIQFLTGFDFLIEVSGELWDMLDDDTRKSLLHHLLLQIDARYSAKEGTWKFKKRKPDYSAFYSIDDKQGSMWYKTVQAAVSSLYDLNPVEEGEVTV